MTVNLVLALALLAPTIVVTVFADRVRDRFQHFDEMRTIVVAVTLALVPVLLVFAATGGMGVFNGIVLTLGLLGVSLQ